MGELGIKAAASALKNMVPNATSSGKAKRSANKRSHVQELDSSEYTPEDEEVVGGGTDLDEEPITLPSLERRAELKKLAARKVLATKPKMPPGSKRASKRVMASSPSQQPPGVSTRSSKRQLLQEPENNCDQTIEADELQPTSPVGERVAADQDADVAAPCVQQNQTSDAGKKLRPPTKGVMLERMTRGMGRRLPIIVAEGMKRPEQPVQAAKLASEAGVIIRAEVPILTHWKDYKNDSSHFGNFMGNLLTRYRRKNTYFNNVPANEIRTTSPVDYMTDKQWQQLVLKWSSVEGKAISEKNKQNRARVRHHQATGSRCYISHLYTYTSMETMMAEPIADGETPRSSAEVVSKLEAEKQGSAVLQEELHVLKKKSEETEEALAKTQKELEEFKKKQEANDLILQHILALSQVNSTPNPNP
ncbi:hypothetical protein E2562_026083 [Oryza meyeriana var. granulata]|uniref:Uncharacterized protein n=1 Tax=Oryza meyeriana var. granulata TaxID=110450 RepID=A0A6G1EZ60_9ORYZ|nr:hypothetical protein E2562_026083 [Oryza meyeriana var. granulata]